MDDGVMEFSEPNPLPNNFKVLKIDKISLLLQVLKYQNSCVEIIIKVFTLKFEVKMGTISNGLSNVDIKPRESNTRKNSTTICTIVLAITL